MKTHTPGPWVAWRPIDDWAVSTDYTPKAPGWTMPARLAEEVYGVNDSECEANARLMAAAPELLGVLRDLLHAHEAAEHSEEDPFPDCLDGAREWLERIHAAIAKAEGRS